MPRDVSGGCYALAVHDVWARVTHSRTRGREQHLLNDGNLAQVTLRATLDERDIGGEAHPIDVSAGVCSVRESTR